MQVTTERLDIARDTSRELWGLLSPQCKCSEGRCRNGPPAPQRTEFQCAKNCIACSLYEEVARIELPKISVSVGSNKNSRLAVLLGISPLVCRLFDTALEGIVETAQQNTTKKTLRDALSSLLGCQEYVVTQLRSVGKLSTITPHILDVRLSRGWGKLLDALRRISTAVFRQPNRTSQLVALLCVKKTIEREAANLEEPAGAALLQWAEVLAPTLDAERQLDKEYFAQVSHYIQAR